MRAKINFDGTITWKTRNPNRREAVAINPPPQNTPIDLNSFALVIYAGTKSRLGASLQSFGYSISTSRSTKVFYEYWAKEDSPQSWSLNNPNGMKYAGFAEAWTHVHRLVFFNEGRHRPVGKTLADKHVVLSSEYFIEDRNIPIKELALMLGLRLGGWTDEGAREIFVTGVETGVDILGGFVG